MLVSDEKDIKMVFLLYTSLLIGETDQKAKTVMISQKQLETITDLVNTKVGEFKSKKNKENTAVRDAIREHYPEFKKGIVGKGLSFEIEHKEGINNLVTEVDTACEAVIINKIKHQTLLITGDMDRLTPKSASMWLESHLKESQLKLIKGASHIPFLSHSDEFFNCLDQFLLAA